MKKIFFLFIAALTAFVMSCTKLEVEGPPLEGGPITITIANPTAGALVATNSTLTVSGTIAAPKGVKEAYLTAFGIQYPITAVGGNVLFEVAVPIPENLATNTGYDLTVYVKDFDNQVQNQNVSITLTQGVSAQIISPIAGITSAFLAGVGTADFKMRLETPGTPDAITLTVPWVSEKIAINLGSDNEYQKDANDPKGSYLVMKSVSIPFSVASGDYDYHFEITIGGRTYEVAQKLEVAQITELFVLGSATSAGWDIDNPIAMSNMGTNKFRKTLPLQGTPNAFKFVLKKGSWDINWGTTTTDPIAVNTEYDLIRGGADISVPADGNYIISVDFNTGKFKVVPFNPPAQLFLVGGSTPAGWTPANSAPFKKVADGVFEIFTPLTAAGGGFKFLEVQDWAGDWGNKKGTTGVLEQDDEENCTVAEDGFYRITVDFNTNTWVALKLTWGVIGSGVGGWDSDHDMTYVGGAEPYTWELANYPAVDGEIKFRANDAWDINFGDDNADGTLEYNGANIALTAGTHTIRMTLAPSGYTYQILGKKK